MAVNWTKPVETEDGRQVRVLCTDVDTSAFPVVVAITYTSDDDCTCAITGCYTKDGEPWGGNSTTISHKEWPLLRNVQPKLILREGWIRIMEDDCDGGLNRYVGCVWDSEDGARFDALDRDETPHDVIHIEWEEPEHA